MCQTSQKGRVAFPLAVRISVLGKIASVLTWFEPPILILSLKLKSTIDFPLEKGKIDSEDSHFSFPFTSLFIIPHPLSWKLEKGD